MKTSAILSAAATFSIAYSTGSIEEWAPGGPDDFRGPCPMMNTLANHGYLPHDGKNLTKETVVAGLGNGLNFDPVLAGIMWEQAIFVAGPNATAFTLNDLNPHGVLEHDASLSRSDAHFGSNHVFNQTVFDTSKAFFTDETITIRMIADAKVFRQVISRSTNPDYSFSASVENFSLGEMAAPFLALGDKTNGLVNRTLVEFWIENEKLPAELGWKRVEEPVVLENVMFLVESIGNATSLITASGNSTAPHKKRSVGRDLHSGAF